MTTEIIKGYKVTDSEMKCRGFQYELGKDYEHNNSLRLCGSGFHFCIKANHCFNYYDFDSRNRVFEIEAFGTVEHGDDKSVTSGIRLIRELQWAEVLNVVNAGLNNTGHSNTGDSNTGNRNTGYSNTGDRNTGAFCAGEQPFTLFNKPSDWTEEDFRNSRAYYLLCNYVDTKQWVPSSSMTESEKKANPSHNTCEGFLRDIPFKDAFGIAWNNWTAENRQAFTSLPNFDSGIFEEITGVKTN